ncbi:unnamed protein product [Heligmosomoides polygyrus]|uniref:Uncharacterized protein n=1 Tax=Heligmosomoides polygyrus TaxID=6339 RepID=A0A183FXV1_HELPZ|nr:unnamed protein product [Heligmosomoides polygyrus]
MTLFVPLERGGSIEPLWHATGTNGDAAGARSSKSMINGTTDDTGAARALLGARPGKAGEAAGLAPYGTGEEFTNVAGTAGSVGPLRFCHKTRLGLGPLFTDAVEASPGHNSSSGPPNRLQYTGKLAERSTALHRHFPWISTAYIRDEFFGTF